MSAVTEPLISRAEWLLDPNVSFLNHGRLAQSREPVVAFAGSFWSRISAQTYNSLPEYRLAVVRSRRNPPRA
jgi:hypothetical protein